MRQPRSAPTDRWAAFTKALTDKPEKRPEGEGWKTIREIAKEFDVPIGKARKAVKAMKHERFIGSIMRHGNLNSETWYRPIL
jgi:hypothetical protein